LEAVEILRKNNENDLNLANIYNLLGITYCHMNQYKDALEVLESSYAIYSLKLEKNNPKMIKLEKDIIKLKENLN
jgi:tetratricopeptide (TPR) repeat protein